MTKPLIVVTEQAASRVAQDIAKIIRSEAHPVIGLATGSTPIPVYKELIRMHKEENLDFSNVMTINLDEYYGLDGSHEQSYRYFMYDNLFNHVNIKHENTHFLNGKVPREKIHDECARYEELVAAHPPHIWLLGIGHNGHIAFNEPPSDAHTRTRLVDLTESTITANTRFFATAAEVPRQSLTVGISTILKAKSIVMLATGAAKKPAVTRCLGEMSPECPASYLQLSAHCVIYTDFPVEQ